MSEGYTEWETFRQIDEKTGNTDKVLFPSSWLDILESARN